MTVAELIKELSKFPPDKTVIIWSDYSDDYVPVGEVRVRADELVIDS